MLTIVLGVAVIGIAMLAVAILTGNTVVAVVVIALAALGLLLLARDWMRERRLMAEAGQSQAGQMSDSLDAHREGHTDASSLQPDEFEPDVLYEEPESSDDARRDSATQ
jgi:UPF0716 family protein affecting phage T7 exclusion